MWHLSVAACCSNERADVAVLLNFTFINLDLEWTKIWRQVHQGNPHVFSSNVLSLMWLTNVSALLSSAYSKQKNSHQHWCEWQKLDFHYLKMFLSEVPPGFLWEHVFVTKVLRKMLDKIGLTGVGIIAADGDWSIANAMISDQSLNDSVDVIG